MRKNMNYNGAVLFDLDGTLVDSAADFIIAVNRILAEDGFSPLPSNDIRNCVSNGARALIKLAYPTLDDDSSLNSKLYRLLDIYEEELGKNSTLFEGYEVLLNSLESNNIAWGIVTNKPARFTLPLLERLNIKPSNNVAVCPDHVTQTKPHAEPLLLAAKKLNLQPSQCLYVGDHIRDIQAGKNAEMQTIACAFGYIHPSDNIADWHADIIVNSVNDLHLFLKQHFHLS